MRPKNLVCVTVLSVLLVGCGTAPGNGTKSKQLLVGGILSKSGGAAAYGGDADRGAQLAFERFNRSGDSFKVSYISLDDKSDKTEAVKAARNLIEADHAQVLLGPAISPSSISVGQMADELQVPMVSTSATQDEVTVASDYRREFVFRVCFNDGFQGQALAAFARNSLAKKTAVIVFDKTLSYSIGLSKEFQQAFTRLGGTVLHEENYSVKDTDYSSLIDKVARYDAELLFIPGWDENVGPMMRQAGDKWHRFVILGGDGLPTSRFLELSAGTAHNVYALSHFSPDEPSPEVREFEELYKGKYGETASPFAALGYDAALLILDAAKRAPTWKGSDLKNALRETKNLHLTTGTLSFDTNHNPAKDAVIVRLDGNRIVFQQRIHI